MIRRFNRLARNQRGGAAVEFALLAPVFIALMMGVVEVGVYMQNYSAVRSLATDASRFTAVEYQKNNKISTTTLENNIRLYERHGYHLHEQFEHPKGGSMVGTMVKPL